MSSREDKGCTKKWRDPRDFHGYHKCLQESWKENQVWPSTDSYTIEIVQENISALAKDLAGYTGYPEYILIRLLYTAAVNSLQDFNAMLFGE